MPARSILYCPTCGHRTTQVRVIEFMNSPTTANWACISEGLEQPPDDFDPFASEYALVLCEVCESPILYNSSFGQAKLEDLVFPRADSLSRSVPESVAAFYNEAVKVRPHSASSFAVQIGRALEALIRDRKIQGGTLNDGLAELGRRNEIPGAFAEMSEILRILRNFGAHATSVNLDSNHVQAIDEFFRAITEYVYVAPARLTHAKALVEKLKAKSQRS